MAFTMHSHSGQFCPGHARDDLEAVIRHAASVGYKTIGLTEHMPRTELGDLYPEELAPDPAASLAVLGPRHQAYLAEAARLQEAEARASARGGGGLAVLVGFEGEWIRPGYGDLVAELAADPRVDYFVGSLHHAGAVPIDFDAAYYARAVADVGRGSEESLWETYYDQQADMLRALRPPVVGHFDLVRLFSSDPARDPRLRPGVWRRVVRNLGIVAEYGGWLELNTSALRKGLAEPYPGRVIAVVNVFFFFGEDITAVEFCATRKLKE